LVFPPQGVGALAPTFPLPLCHPERSSPIFSSAPMCACPERSRRGASGCVVEGPWQPIKSYRARWNPPQFQTQALSLIPRIRAHSHLGAAGSQPPVAQPPPPHPALLRDDSWLCSWVSLLFRESVLLRSLGGRGFSPGANHPKTILPPIPIPHPNPRTGDFNRQERLSPFFSSRGSSSSVVARRGSKKVPQSTLHHVRMRGFPSGMRLAPFGLDNSSNCDSIQSMKR
jgi:hypothetical protein